MLFRVQPTSNSFSNLGSSRVLTLQVLGTAVAQEGPTSATGRHTVGQAPKYRRNLTTQDFRPIGLHRSAMEERQQRCAAEPAELGHFKEAAHPVWLLAKLVPVQANVAQSTFSAGVDSCFCDAQYFLYDKI